jgi:hypothetical protein
MMVFVDFHSAIQLDTRLTPRSAFTDNDFELRLSMLRCLFLVCSSFSFLSMAVVLMFRVLIVCDAIP